ncbi:MAG: hypothetical protein ACYCVD_04080 [Desulfitobacteriaceae bacterium]
MNITLNIVAGSSAELQEAINGLASLAVITGGAVAPKSETEKPKRGNKVTTQTETPSENEPGVESGAVEDTGETAPDKVEENIPTVVDLRAKAQEKGGTPEGKKAIKALLDAFGSKSISDVPEERRTEFLQKLGEIK